VGRRHEEGDWESRDDLKMIKIMRRLGGLGMASRLGSASSRLLCSCTVRIGNVELSPIGGLPALMPSPASLRGVAYSDSQHALEIVQWLMKKQTLRQDAMLLGSHPAALRQLVFRFAELTEREVEVVSISRDTTESDLKQRRELVGGGSVEYVNQPVVEAALRGRLLVLEGLEKAERNLLPIINNLLENREMALEDGGFLMHPDRVDALRRDGMSDAELASRRLLRVSPDFMVVALGLPVPRFPGTPLDPPLRSRFQARVVPAPPAAARKAALAELAPTAASELAKAVDAFDALDALHATRAGGGGGGGSADLSMPCPPAATLVSIAKLISVFPGAPLATLLPRLLPHAASTPEVRSLLARLELPIASDGGSGGAAPYAFESISVEGSVEGTRVAEAVWTATIGAERVRTTLACGPRLGRRSGAHCDGLEGGLLADLPRQSALFSAMLQDHAVGMDMCLIGPKGSGKTAAARRFASALGYDGVTVYCYADLSARDLLQRRVTAQDGSTRWEHSEPVRAALDGELLVLDNVHRLPPGVLAATLGRLLTDRELQLPDGTRLVPRARYDALLAASAGDALAAAAVCGKLVPIHPAFRVLATAEPPQAWAEEASAGAAAGGSGSWLGSELLGLFHFHRVDRLDLADTEALVAHQASAAAAAASLSVEPRGAALARSQLLSLHQLLVQTSTRHALGLSTRGLLRAARHASLYPADVSSTVMREIAGRQGALSESAELELSELMRRAGLPTAAAAAARVDLPPPRREAAPDGTESVVLGDVRLGGITPAARPELVPDVLFYDSPRHSLVLQSMLKDWTVGAHLLLIGSQGVGKNKLVDRMLGLLRREREYMQLHRDVTVAALTQTPTLVDGKLQWEDCTALPESRPRRRSLVSRP